MKVAIIHDWLTGMRGGERCLLAFLAIYPQADVHTMLHVPGTTSSIIDSRVRSTSILQKFPRSSKWYRYYLPLYPLAAKSISLSGYDLVISLSHAVSKNVKVPNDTMHVCYCFTPMRYIWDQADSYFGSLTPLFRPIQKILQRWDVQGAKRVKEFVAISDFIKSRIHQYYNRDATVIYPPVDTSWIHSNHTYKKGEAFLYAGALVPYKKSDQVVEAFNALGEPLWIAGSGPMESRLRKMAKSNIKFLGRISDAELGNLYGRSRALVFPGVEDFGMIPVECMASGRPVIALYEGGAKETVRGICSWKSNSLDEAPPTGVFYQRMGDAPEPMVIASAVSQFMKIEKEINPQACIAQARRFSPERFFSEWLAFSRSKLGVDTSNKPNLKALHA